MMTLTHIDLFSGIGGFALAFQRAGMQTVAHVEIDPTCQRVLRHRFPGHLILSDVCEAGAHNLPPADVITFGSPCQDLSVAGKRAGLAGAKSGLFHESIRICRELRPTIAVWENVPGAFSSHRGRDFAAVLAAFCELGARDIAWRVLDAQHFGVPQRRRRIFLVADFGGERAGEILFESGRVSGPDLPRRETRKDVTPTLDGRAGSSGSHTFNTIGGVVPIAPTLAKGGAGGGYSNESMMDGALVAFDTASDLRRVNRTRAEPGLPTSTLNTAGPVFSFQTRYVRNGRGAPADIPPPLLAQNGGSGKGDQSPLIAGPSIGVRRFTPRECERLQGFPDGWTAVDETGKPIPDSRRYHMLGNAVAVPVVEWIGRRIIRSMERDSNTVKSSP